jgi:hypothetical protein
MVGRDCNDAVAAPHQAAAGLEALVRVELSEALHRSTLEVPQHVQALP